MPIRHFLLLSFLLFLATATHPIGGESIQCRPSDRRALQQINTYFNNAFPSWGVTPDCCTWNGVSCDPTTNWVTGLDIFGPTGTYITRPMPAAIADLPYLQTIMLRRLNLSGNIPPAITKLKFLSFMDLSWNQLSGPVPEFLSQIKTLNSIFLSFNQFTGSIPASLASLDQLYSLSIDNNNLTGTIPESLGNSNIQYLVLSNNHLTGEVPRSLGKANFARLDFSHNELRGDISFLFGANKSLNTADFSWNKFEFDFSKVEIPSIMLNLYIQHNRIFGSLPKEMAPQFDAIFPSLNVSYNRLCGEIPTGGSLQRFDSTVFFHNKCLCGAPLPPCK